jgi:hypothetical protein
MRALLLVFLLGGVAGCGKAEATKVAEKMAEEVCACPDMGCARKALEFAAKRFEELKDTRGREKDAKAIVAAGERARGCVAKLAGVGPAAAVPVPAVPVPAPPAPASK